jgi:hypothetical protein
MKTLHTNSTRILSREQAIEILSPHLQAIEDCIKEAWKQWERFGEIAPELRKPFNAAERAMFIYRHIVENAKHKFCEIEGVQISEKRGFLSLIFDGKLVLRFKKFDRGLRSSGIPTRQYEIWKSQQMMPGFEQTRIIGGYRVDSLKRSLFDIHITCPIGSQNEWSFELQKGLSVDVEKIIPESSEERSIVRAKGAEAKKVRKDSKAG